MHTVCRQRRLIVGLLHVAAEKVRVDSQHVLAVRGGKPGYNTGLAESVPRFLPSVLRNVMIPTTISCSHMLSFSAPTTQSSLLASMKRERALARYAVRVSECSAASLILPRLYLSNLRIASDTEELTELGITHVISVLEYAPEYSDDQIKQLHINLEDTFTANILDHLQTTTEFIRSALDENPTNKVLVRPQVQ